MKRGTPQVSLKEIMEQRIQEPGILGRIACYLRQNEPIEQHHKDGRSFDIFWRNRGDHWRCTMLIKDSELCLVQIDIHDDKAVRVEMWEPCSVTVDPALNLLCLSRLKT